MNASVQQTFISNRSTGDTTFEIFENAHTTISNIHAECRGKALDSKWITFYYPQSRDKFIDSGRVHKIAFPPDLKPQETVSYTYEESFEDLAFFPLIRVPVMNSLARYELIVDHPADFQVDFQVFDAHDPLKPTIDHSIATRTSILFENLAEPQDVPSDPFKWIHAAVLTKISRAGSPVNPHTPESFTTWYLGFLEPVSSPSDQMKTLLSEELSKAASQREKARILFDYVKTQIRYVADEGSGHAYLPHPCSEVLEKKWGDCKDKARLLTALAKIHNIPLHMVLLNTHPAPGFSEVSIGLFNHVICVLDDGGELIFMDPTYAQSELGDPPGSDLLMRGLVLDPANPRYVVIPARGTTPDLDLFLEGDLSALNKGKAKLILRHSRRMQTLQARKELNDRDFEKYLTSRFEQVLFKLPLEHFRVIQEDRESLILEADADMSDFLITTDVRVFAPTAPFRAIDPELLEREKDSYALDASGPKKYRLELTLAGPGMDVKPERITLGEEGGARYTALSSGSAGKSQLVYAIEQPFRLVPPESRAAFLKFCDDYLKSNRKFFTFQRRNP